jgi:arylsulfatase A-like enzyme
MLFEVLAAAGLRTASFTSHFYFEPRRNVGQGIAEYDNAGARDLAGSNLDYAAPRVVPKAIARIESLAAERKRFAMFVHLFEPHSTYVDHPEHPVTTRGEPGLIERYDYEIAVDDDWIGKILGALDRAQLTDNTLVVVLSDHGEAFGSHRFAGQRAFFHGQTLYDEILRVPLLIRIPGVPASVHDDIVGLIDVAPTIVDALGLKQPPTFTGRSLVPLARGESLVPRNVRAEILPTPDLNDTIKAVVTGDGDEKVIVSGADRHAEVYDLRKDPDERTDLAGRNDDRVKRLRAILDAAP